MNDDAVLASLAALEIDPLLALLRGRLGLAEGLVAALREGGFAAEVTGRRGTASVESAYEHA